MIEYIISGSTRKGEATPCEHGMTTYCIQQVVDAYKKKHPDCVHVCLDIALDDTHITV